VAFSFLLKYLNDDLGRVYLTAIFLIKVLMQVSLDVFVNDCLCSGAAQLKLLCCQTVFGVPHRLSVMQLPSIPVAEPECSRVFLFASFCCRGGHNDAHARYL
jgi:hypothetical protein